MVTDSGVPVSDSLIVTRVKSNGMLVKGDITSKDTKSTFGLTGKLFVASRKCV